MVKLSFSQHDLVDSIGMSQPWAFSKTEIETTLPMHMCLSTVHESVLAKTKKAIKTCKDL